MTPIAPKQPVADQCRYRGIGVRTRRLDLAAILLLTLMPVSNVAADPYIQDVDAIDVLKIYEEYLDSSDYALRSRLVAINSESLRGKLIGLAGSASTNDPAIIRLRLFDDVLLIANILTNKNGQMRFFAKTADSTCKPDKGTDGSNGSLEISELGHVTGRFWVCDQIYTIGPTPDLRLPFHIVQQLDPMNLPSID